MADGVSTSSRLSKLARLKNLKSGLNASDDAPKSKEPLPAVEEEKDSESLSAYFEALGIVPDGGQPAPPQSKIKKPEKTQETGRPVEAGDLWQDPVRNDDAFITSFEGKGDDADAAEDLSLDSIIGDFAGEEEAPPAKPEAADAIPEVEVEAEPEIEALPDFETEATEDSGQTPEPEVETAPDEFDMPIDIEAFEAEAAATMKVPEPGITDADIPPLDASEEPVVAPAGNQAPDDKAAGDTGRDQPLTITFDESRATLLHHVSKQMNCSIDDVVVTAIDWYLDALFGEDDPDLKAEAEGS